MSLIEEKFAELLQDGYGIMRVDYFCRNKRIILAYKDLTAELIDSDGEQKVEYKWRLFDVPKVLSRGESLDIYRFLTFNGDYDIFCLYKVEKDSIALFWRKAGTYYVDYCELRRNHRRQKDIMTMSGCFNSFPSDLVNIICDYAGSTFYNHIERNLADKV